jgi:DNA repair exonuclease SbcCD ATPase subunit
MHLTRIQIEGFGCLRGNDVRFGPGINLVIGPNEAGKSTLQEAIVAALFGLGSERAGLLRSGPLGTGERWRPWQPGPFKLALEVLLHDGTRLRIERDFDGQRARVLELLSGADITERFEADAWGGLAVGRQLLGVSRDVYTNTACISRSEVMRLDDAGAIREAIAALADSAQPDRTAQRVLERLRQERIRRVGIKRARGGPLSELSARLNQLEQELASARQARAALNELAQKREAAAAVSGDDLARVTALDAAVLAGRLDEANRRLDMARRLDQEVTEERGRQLGNSRFSALPIERQPEVLELRSHLRAILDAQHDFESGAAAVAGQLADVEAERLRTAAELSELEAKSRGIDPLALKEEPLLRELVSSLTFADAQAPEVHLRSHACAEEVRRLAERHPGLIGPSINWGPRQIEFQRALSEWRERNEAAVEARRRAGLELPPRLEQLKQDIARYKEVPEVVKAGQQAEEAMRREEAMAERARSRQGTFLGMMLGGLLLIAFAVLVAFLAFSSNLPVVAYAAAVLGGMGLLAAVVGIWARGTALREVDRRLKAKDIARTRRREILAPWGVRSAAELQQALVEHLQKVRFEATRLELDRQAGELEERAQAAGRTLRELVGSWGLPQPAPTAESIEETARRVEELASDAEARSAASQRAQEAARAVTALDERREMLRQRLHGVLDRLGYDRMEALAAGREFLASCEAARSAAQVRTRIEQLDARLEQLRQPSVRAQREQEKADEYRRRLQQIYESAGVQAANPELADEAWDEALAAAMAYRSAISRIAELEQQRRAAVGSTETAALARLVQDLEQQVGAASKGADAQHLAELRALPIAELERRREEQRSLRERLREERARADEILEDRLKRIGDLAAIEEELVTARERLEELEREAQAYDLAIETIESAARAVRRAVVPQLKAHLQAQLASVTNGRYRDVLVGDDLALQVLSTEQRSFRDVDALSLGTRSLIYLLERVALARIIGGTAEPSPLMLDEALVHSDRRRVRAALDELGRLGEEYQIVLFSKDEALAERGEKAGNWTIIRLPGPATGALTLEAPPESQSGRPTVLRSEPESSTA